jgi:hypothetical protein
MTDLPWFSSWERSVLIRLAAGSLLGGGIDDREVVVVRIEAI